MATIRKIKIKDSVYQLEDWRINSITEEPIVDSTDPISSGAVAALKEEIDEHFNAIESDTENLHNDLESKVDKVEGKTLSTEDYSTEEKDKLAGIELGANVNLIESVAVNGIELSINNKEANIIIPVKLVDLGDDIYHRTVSDTEKETWNDKQDAISDLEEIRSNAAEGASKISNVQADWKAVEGLGVILNKPEIPSIAGLATEEYVNETVASLISSAPETLDTLQELAAALGDDPNFASTVSTELGKKYEKPITGVPKTDLTDSVQESLNKADTALQAHQTIKTINNESLIGEGNIDLAVEEVHVVKDDSLGKIVLTIGNSRFALTGEQIEKPTAPTLTAGGTFVRSKSISITSSTNGATIRYTMSSNGIAPVDPTINTGTVGTSITLPQDTSSEFKTYIIKAIAVKNGEVSDVVSDTYIIKRQLDNVTISLSGNTYSETRTVTITSTNSGIPIYYTIDGSNPTSNSLVYNSNNKPIISSSCTIKARAIADNWELSTNVASATCTVKNIQNVTISADTNEYARSRTLTLACATNNVSIYYTLNGSTPTSSSMLYDSSDKPIITSTCTVKAIAIRYGWTSSTVTSQSITVAKANVRYGYTEDITIDLEGIYNLSNYVDKVSPLGEYSTSTINAAYLWFCIPSNQSFTSIKSSGYSVPMESPVTIGGFKCYRSSNKHAAGTVITFNVE